MTKLLHVSPDQALPVAVLQDSTTIFGRKRVGKSNNAVVIVEEYLDLHGQVIVIDPKGDWWGMTSSADGKAEGYPLVIIGGKHTTPGVELNPLAGATTAEWVIKTGYSVILDLSQLRPRETEQFCSAFLERIRRLKVDNPGPILIVIDEADELAPEDKNARMAIIDTYAAVVWMVKRGGFAGIGTLVITQRPASLSKNVTTQSETVIVLQVTGSQDVDAIADALKHHVAGETKKDRTAALEELLRSIVQLDKGQAVIVSASPELKGRILTVPFRRRKTFDSGATPKFGEQPKPPKVVAKVALAQLTAEMEKAVAEAKANDPSLLRGQLAERDKRIRELEQRPAATVARTVEVPILKNGALKQLATLSKQWLAATDNMLKAELLSQERSATVHTIASGFGAAIKPVADELARLTGEPRTVVTLTPPAAPAAVRHQAAMPPASKPARPAAAPAEGVTPAQQRILNALAVLEEIGIARPTKTQVALLAQASPTSSSYGNNLGALRTLGLIDYPGPSLAALTADGRRSATAEDAPRTTAELHAFVRKHVSPAQWRIVDALIKVYPTPLAKDDLALRVGASATSSSYGNNLGALRTLGLIDYPRAGEARAEPVLFLEADR